MLLLSAAHHHKFEWSAAAVNCAWPDWHDVQVAEELGLSLDAKETAGMVSEFDTNRDGRIDLTEFRSLLALAAAAEGD